MTKRFSTIFLCCSLLIVSQTSYADDTVKNKTEQSAKPALPSKAWGVAKIVGGSFLVAVGTIYAGMSNYYFLKEIGDFHDLPAVEDAANVSSIGGVAIALGFGVVERGLKDFSQGLKNATQENQKNKSDDATSLKKQKDCSLLMASQASCAGGAKTEQPAKTGLLSRASLGRLVWAGVRVAGGSFLVAVGSVSTGISNYYFLKEVGDSLDRSGAVERVGKKSSIGGVAVAFGVGVVECGLKDFSQGLKDAMQADQEKKSEDETSLKEQKDFVC